MASSGTASRTIVKVKFLNDIRKTVLLHNQDVTFNDLVLMIQRIFSINPTLPINLKYKDSEDDFVLLTDDNDVLIAIQTERLLFIEVSVANESSEQLAEIQKQISSIQASVDLLARKLVGLSTVVPQHEPVHPSSVPAALSPPPVEVAPATIQPSLHQQVTSDAHQHEHQHESVVESRGPDTSSGSIEEEINLGGEAAEFSEYPTPSIPSFPQAQAPLPPTAAAGGVPPALQSIPDPVPTQYQHQQAPQFPPLVAPQPQYPPSFAQPPQAAGGPPPPPTSYGGASAPPPIAANFGAPPPPQFGGAPPSLPSAPPSAPPSSFGGAAAPPPPQSANAFAAPPTSFAPPTSHYAPPPPTTQQYTPQVSSSFAAPPTSGYPPVGVNSYAPPTSQQQQQQFAPIPTGFAPPPPANFGGFGAAPPPSYPPSGFAPPPMGGAGGIAGAPNPFARPPTTDYRQSPYHHQ